MRQGPFQFFGAAAGPLLVTLFVLAISLFLGLAVYPTISYNVLPLQVCPVSLGMGLLFHPRWACKPPFARLPRAYPLDRSGVDWG